LPSTIFSRNRSRNPVDEHQRSGGTLRRHRDDPQPSTREEDHSSGGYFRSQPCQVGGFDRWTIIRRNEGRRVSTVSQGMSFPGDQGSPVEKLFTMCAQYQSLTRAISYQGETIRFFGSLYGAWASVNSIVEEIIKYGTMGLWRHKAPGTELQNAALSYVRNFGPIGKPQEAAGSPDAMIFGHTHREGMVFLGEPGTASTGSGKGILLVNDGGFIHDPPASSRSITIQPETASRLRSGIA